MVCGSATAAAAAAVAADVVVVVAFCEIVFLSSCFAKGMRARTTPFSCVYIKAALAAAEFTVLMLSLLTT